MGMINTRLHRQTAAVDELTGKPIMFTVNPPGYELFVSTKQSKQPYSIGFQDLLNALRTAKGHHFTAQPRPQPKRMETPDISDTIKEVLAENERLHFSQVRQQLRKRGIEVSRRVTGSLLKLMAQTKQIEHDDKMYYSLTKAS